MELEYFFFSRPPKAQESFAGIWGGMLGTKDETVLCCTAHPEVTTQTAQSTRKKELQLVQFPFPDLLPDRLQIHSFLV